MTLSLKKAHSVQQGLKSALHDVRRKAPATEIDAMVSVDIVADCSDLQTQYDKGVSERLVIMDAIMEIRNEVALANAKIGIAGLMGMLATLDVKIDMYDDIVRQGEREDVEKIAKKVERQEQKNANNERSFISSGEVDVSIFDKEYIEKTEEILHKLKIEKRKAEEKILEYNFSTKIVLTQSTMDLLRKLGLVD
jgi:hypothetical protein